MEITEKMLSRMVNDANASSRKQLKIMIGLIAALGGGGGAWAWNTHGSLADAAETEAATTATLRRHEAEMRETSERVESIAILLVQQGRHFEEMVRSVAPVGAKLPDRPSALDKIEQEILRRGGR